MPSKKRATPISLQPLDALFGTNEETNNGICEIEIGSLHPFPNHPFQVKDGRMINSLRVREKRWIRRQQRSSCLKEKSIIRIWYQEKQGDSTKQLWRWLIPEREMYSSI